ncbi:Uncharacterised protein [Segatella copri]|nr:Uncharacterised protein [Segatella copri]
MLMICHMYLIKSAQSRNLIQSTLGLIFRKMCWRSTPSTVQPLLYVLTPLRRHSVLRRISISRMRVSIR